MGFFSKKILLLVAFCMMQVVHARLVTFVFFNGSNYPVRVHFSVAGDVDEYSVELAVAKKVVAAYKIPDGAFFKIDWLAVHGIQRHGFTGYEEHVPGETETIKIIVLDTDDNDDKGVESLVMFKPNVKIGRSKNSIAKKFMRLCGCVPRP